MYIFEINSLSIASFAIIFSHFEGYLFTLLIVSFVVQKLLILIRSHLFIFAFISNILGAFHEPLLLASQGLGCQLKPSLPLLEPNIFGTMWEIKFVFNHSPYLPV